MRRNFFYHGIIALLLLSNTCAFAKTSENKFLDPILNSPGNWFISAGAGAQYPQWHNLMKIHNNSELSAPNDKDLYSTKNQSEPILALSLGKRWQSNQFWLPSYSFGVFWQYFFRTHLGRTVAQHSLPAFTNYKYKWDLTANVLLASAKLNLFQYGKIAPYVNGGIGSSFNRTSNYQETALPGVAPRTSPRFGKFSTSEFAYNAGVGVDLQLTPQFIISVGYNYFDLGQISSGPGKEIWSDQSLNPGSYHSNEILVSLSYLFAKT
jgi:opacity protein-like surface antigen